MESIRHIDGVLNIELKNDTFLIGCSHDATHKIVMTIVESGASITCLNKKEYGLNDIYNRYFEGV
jgi:ABC-2 type transport system ATP-binding protein